MLSPLRAAAFAVLAALAATASGAAADDMAVVASRIVYPGETIRADSLTEVRLRPGNRVPTSIAVYPEQVEGKVARRTLLPGKPIPLSSVREAWLVEAGAPAVVAYVNGGLEISTVGVALQPGAAGDMIKVRNADTGSILSGIVLADGSIRVGP